MDGSILLFKVDRTTSVIFENIEGVKWAAFWIDELPMVLEEDAEEDMFADPCTSGLDSSMISLDGDSALLDTALDSLKDEEDDLYCLTL